MNQKSLNGSDTIADQHNQQTVDSSVKNPTEQTPLQGKDSIQISSAFVVDDSSLFAARPSPRGGRH